MEKNDVLEIIRSRRSIRHFSGEKIDKSDLLLLVEAGRWAPSAGNLQPLEIIIVRDDDTKYDLSQAAGGQEFLAECSHVFVMTANIPRTSKKYRSRGENLYSIQDIAAATQNILLLAHDLGIGSCWVGAFDEEQVSMICNLPEYVRPTVMIALGYPDPEISPVVRPRRPPDQLIHWGTW